MKKSVLVLFAVMLALLVACSNDNKEGSVETGDEESTEVAKDELEKVEGEQDSSKAVEIGQNLFSEDVIFEYQDGDVKMLLDLAEFTEEFSTETGEDVQKKNLPDNEILFHIKGSIMNDSLDIFSYGHGLGDVQFKLIYDDKHEFELLGITESTDGSKFEGAEVHSLEEQKIHLFADVPVAVSESDKSLVLLISDNDGEHEEVLR